MEPEIISAYDQGMSNFLSDEHTQFLKTLSVDQQTSRCRVFIHIIGRNKVGKSMSANEIIQFPIQKIIKKKIVEIKALFPVSSKALTSCPVFHITNNTFEQGKFNVKEIDQCKDSEFQEVKQSTEITFETLKQVERHQQQHREILFRLYEQKDTLEKQYKDNPSNEALIGIRKSNEYLTKHLKKAILIQSSYKALSDPTLNKYVVVKDTVGSNDKANIASDKISEEQKPSEQIRYPQFISRPNDCAIYCMNLASAFNKSYIEQILDIYTSHPEPENIMFSFNLSDYLKYEPDFQCISNTHIFLEELFCTIPKTCRQIFMELADRIQEEKKRKYFQSKIQVFDSLLETVESLFGTNDYLQKFQQLVEDDRELQPQLIHKFPFDIIKFHGKQFIKALEKDIILMQVFKEAKQIFEVKIQNNIKANLSNYFNEVIDNRRATFNKIELSLGVQLKRTFFFIDEQSKALQFEQFIITNVINEIKGILNQQENEKRQLDVETLIQFKEWAEKVSENRPQQKSFYLFKNTANEEVQKEITAIINKNTSKTVQIFQKIPNRFNKSLEGKIQAIKGSIDREQDQKIRKIKEQLVNLYITNLIEKIVETLGAQFQAHNQMLARITEEGKLYNLELNIKKIKTEQIIREIADTFIGAIAPALGIVIGVLRFAAIGALQTMGVGFLTVPTLVASMIYIPFRHFSSKSKDNKFLEQWERITLCFDMIRDILSEYKQRQISSNKVFSRQQSLINQRHSAKAEYTKMQQSKYNSIKSLIEQVLKQKAEYLRDWDNLKEYITSFT